jgi:putative restriction endonuclease
LFVNSFPVVAMAAHTDEILRATAFAALNAIVGIYGQPLSWNEISQGFTVGGEKILFANRARGIFKPAVMQRGVLSVKTTVPRIGRGARYADIHDDTGSFIYRFQGSDPDAHDNRRLRESYEDQSPLIYFYGVSETRYEAIWPAFVTAWNPESLSVQIDVGTRISEAPAEAPAAREIERRYATRATKQRLHQSSFREMVLDAYQERCAFSGLPVRRLLQAAHIVADSDAEGLAAVRNGIALSTIHHAAFDAHLLGIHPDGMIAVSDRLMQYNDGPILEQGLKGMAGSRIHLPKSRSDWPDRDLLARRFDLFTKVN